MVLGNCVGSHVPATGKGQPSAKGIEEYFVRAGVTQYFLMPIRYAGNAGRYADLDLTVRDSAGVIQWATLRVSFTDRHVYAAADTLILEADGALTTLAPARLMFTEPAGKGKTRTRFEAQLPPAVAQAFLKAGAVKLIVETAQGRMPFHPGKKGEVRRRALAVRL